MDSFGLEVTEFAIGLTIRTVERATHYRAKGIAGLIANSKNDETVIIRSLEIISDPLVDDYNKYKLNQMLSWIVGYTKDEERRKYLKTKYDIEEAKNEAY